jgi:hypothetical protein
VQAARAQQGLPPPAHQTHTLAPTNLHTRPPPGTYVITDIIEWRKPLVLRGEGRDKTRLRFPKSMTDL